MSRPTGTVTFLLTDIEGSTRLREERGPAFELALTLHHRLLRDVFVRHGGHEVKELGDGFIVAFEHPADAVACAVEAQRELAQAPWPDGAALRVRMALHTGDIDLVDGEYRGLTLHHASRLADTAHGGQILCSEATAVLLRRGFDPGVRLVDLGAYKLRDVQSPERLSQVSHPDMPAEPFPPPRAEAAYGSQLPATLTRFFGREAELAWLREMLLRDDTHLVTMTGPGGSGKTRLAIEVARQLLDPFHGAVWFVLLQAVRDASLITGAIVDAMELPRSPQLDPLDQAVAALSKQPALLVLDNFEQVVDDGAAVVLTLLERAPSTRYLVTSRRTLDLTPEVEYFLAPLPTPDPEHDVESVMSCESVRLFVDRARAARSDFAVTPANARALGELCERLEGIPLALELAAVRAQVLTPTQMLAQLDHRLDFLATRKRDVPERHRTLRAAIDWSYESLPPDLQRFFARLSVFRGGWTIDAAQEVCEDPNALDHLERLREYSMVLLDTDTTGDTRFRLLETLREYADEQLAEDERLALRERHTEYFSHVVEEAAAELEGPRQAEWFGRLKADHDNLRAALEEASGCSLETMLRIATALWRFWEASGLLAEGRQWLELGLAQPDGASAGVRARALAADAALASGQGDRPALLQRAGECLDLCTELGDQPGVARALTLLACEATYRGELERAVALAEESAALYREVDDERGLVLALFALGTPLRVLQRYERAAAVYEEAAALSGRMHDKSRVACSLSLLARVKMDQEQYAAADVLLQESLSLARDLGASELTAPVLLSLAQLALVQRDHARAGRLIREALITFHGAGVRVGSTYCLATLGLALAGLAEWGRAARLLAAAEAQGEALGLPPGDRPADCIPRMCAALGEEAFATAWAEGRAMPWEKAVAYALTDAADH